MKKERVEMFLKKFKDNKLLGVSCLAISILFLITVFGLVKFRNCKFNYLFHTTGSFIKQATMQEPINKESYPSKLSMFQAHMDLVSKFNHETTTSDKPFKYRLGQLEINFLSYSMLHSLVAEIFMQKAYFFETNKEKPFVIDCGSNIGMATLFFKSLYPKAKILAFEPAGENFKILSQNIKDNNLENITLYNKAVSSQKGHATFYQAGALEGSLQTPSLHPNKETVRTTILSKYVNQEVDLLKIDIEGAELNVLEELAGKDKLKFVKQIILEYHPHAQNNSLSKILKVFEDNNFKFMISSNVNTPFKQNKLDLNLIYAHQS